jgi:hypothetical protein
MQRMTGTHDGQPNFNCSTMQALHSPPLARQAFAGEIADHIISSIIDTRANLACSCCCFQYPITSSISSNQIFSFAVLFIASYNL